jgi:mannose-6-phosphate isomerase-like protein (cupin superfamily)
MQRPVNFAEKLAKFHDHWGPPVVAEMNDYQFKLVKFQGDFVWHRHVDIDEVFIVLRGEMGIAFRDGAVVVGAGEMSIHLIRAHLSVRPSLQRVLVWNRTKERAARLVARLQREGIESDEIGRAHV